MAGSEMNVGNLVAGLTMDTSGFAKGLSNAADGLTNLKKNIEIAKASLISLMTNPAVLAVAAVGALVAVGKAAFDMSEEVNTAYDRIRISTGATGEALEGYLESFNRVAKEVPSTLEEVSEVIAGLASRTDIVGEEFEELGIALLKLARITESDVNTLMENSTRLFGDWGVATEDYTETLDWLLKTSQATGVEIGELTQTVVQYGATLRNLGYTLEEATTLLGKWEKEGVNTETILSGMRIALARFAEEGVDAKTALAQAISEIQTLNSEAGNSLASDVFGSRAASDMAAAIREGRFEFDDLMKAIEESPDTIDAANQATMGFAEQADILRKKVMFALTPLGSGIEVEMDKAFQALNGFADNVLPHLVSFIQFVGGLFAKLREPFEKVLGRIGESFAKFWNDSESSSGDALTNIADLVTLVVDNLAKAIDWFFETVYPVIEFGLAAIVGVIKVVSEVISGDWDALWKRVLELATFAVQGLYNLLEAGWNTIMDGIQFVLQTILDFIFDTINTGLKFIQDAINAIIRGANAAIRAMNEAFGTNISTFGYVTLKVNTPEIPEMTRFSETELGMNLRATIDSLGSAAAGGVSQTIIVNGDITNPSKTFAQTEKQAQRLAQGVYL